MSDDIVTSDGQCDLVLSVCGGRWFFLLFLVIVDSFILIMISLVGLKKNKRNLRRFGRRRFGLVGKRIVVLFGQGFEKLQEASLLRTKQTILLAYLLLLIFEMRHPSEKLLKALIPRLQLDFLALYFGRVGRGFTDQHVDHPKSPDLCCGDIVLSR